ncbi:chloride channel protein [Verrucomicrobium sp. BvORR034]|uniref:chloride channel protein n=1 Tax=Verrucomicrobium sp. BvORR034 TaxID=1396418 RepID=UPI000A415AE8|nr:chloride channel protein [Verrucomicrobium sp. BvORR034]
MPHSATQLPSPSSASALGKGLPAPGAPLADYRISRRVLILSGLAVVAAAVSTVVAKILVWLISTVTNLSFHLTWSSADATPEGHHWGAFVIVVPVVGALIIGLMARYGSEKIRGHGIPEALEAILLGRSRIQPKVALLKPISAAISIGTGGPFGAEGPIIMTGGALGSILAQQFHLSAAERKTLLVAGSAAGMTAIFGTPVAAVLLAVELLLFEWRPRSLIPVAIAAVAATALRPLLLGAGPVFPVAAHASVSGAEIGYASLLGLLVGLGSGVVTSMVYAAEDAFKKVPVHWMWWPAIGAVFVGIGGLIEPRVLGVGYGVIHQMLRGELVGQVLITLAIIKALVWAVALGSGTSGGVLAPLLILGSALGAFLGQWIPGGDLSLWALVGLTAMMGGTMRAPLTAMVFAVELTHDYNVLPALLAGSIAAFAVTVLWLRRSILTEKLARRGQHITCEYSIDPFELARVKDVMDPQVPSVPAHMKLTDLAERIASGDPVLAGHQATFVFDQERRLSGIVTRGDLLRALPDATENPGLTAGEAGSRPLTVTYPDEPLYDALNRMLAHNIGRMPVVDRLRPDHAIGYLGRSAILSARQRLHEEEHHLSSRQSAN